MKIKNRFSDEIIIEDANKSVKQLAEENRADLRGADLWRADLRGANLRGANLSEADLRRADLSEANLWGADLRGANLSEANLRGADLWRADLSEANLGRANNFEFYQFPSIRLISSIKLNNLSDDLQIELMRRDAFAHPHPEKFNDWAIDGKCPYNDDIERFWLFEPKRQLWSPGLPQMADRDLILEICKSQKWDIKGYLKN